MYDIAASLEDFLCCSILHSARLMGVGVSEPFACACNALEASMQLLT
jgi:hypothetical protein